MRTALAEAQDALRSGGHSAVVPEEGPSAGRITLLYGLAAAAVLAVTWALVRQAGLPGWMFGLAVVLLVIGLPILLAIGRIDSARAGGRATQGVVRFLTWRNAIVGGVLAFTGWGALASAMAFRAPAAGDGGAIRLAVLPFRNQGDSSSAYFVDGIADQLRGKLTELGAVQVIARSSSEQYRATTKSPREIGRELDVQYLLSATVLTVRNADGSGRVQVVPELINASTGAVTWQQTFDTPLTDLFQVQSEIAVRVAGALDVALGANEARQLNERPTKSIEAYDAFLKGETARMQAGAAVGRRMAISYYEQAVALDSSFAIAWARMAQTYAGMYFSSPTPELANGARFAAERAAAIAPGSPESHLAMGFYYTNVLGEHGRGQQEYAEGLRLAPNHVDLLVANAVSERALGRWAASVEPLKRALSLDPRSSNAYGSLALTHLWLRQFPQAIAAVDQAIALAPGNATYVGTKTMIYLAQGDRPGALAVIRSAPREIAPTTLAAYFSVTWDLFWVLDPEQQRITLRLTPAFFDDDRSARALAFAGIHHLRGDQVLARAFGDSAHQALAVQLKDLPDDNYLLALDGVALAFAGQRAEAIRAAERSMELLPLAADGLSAPYNHHMLIRTYLLVGEKAKALEAIRQLLAVPYFISPGWLRVDPTFDPLRGDPAFEQLARGG
jgi:TolB-like protein/Flp pilus assembly protein TadD